jgi:hypothetical protein
MALESFGFIDALNSSNPASADAPSAGDDHLRGIKSTRKATFTGGGTGLSGAVTVTHTELNRLAGVTSAVQTQLNALASVTQNTQNANYTLVLADANKHIYKSNTSAYAWTVPPNSAEAFPIGSTVTMYNGGSAGSITITRGIGVVIATAGTGTDSDKTLAPYGLATLLKISTDTWIINGVGLT